MKITKIFSVLVMFLLSCNPTKLAYKRIDKSVDRLGAETVVGYVYDKYNLKKPVIIHTDTITQLKERTLKDTISLRDTTYVDKTIYKDRVIVRVQKIRDTLYIDAKCKDSVIKVVHVTDAKEKYVQTYQKSKFIEFVNNNIKVIRNTLIGLVLFLVLYILYRILRKYFL